VKADGRNEFPYAKRATPLRTSPDFAVFSPEAISHDDPDVAGE
jgi:hypothetical protein